MFAHAKEIYKASQAQHAKASAGGKKSGFGTPTQYNKINRPLAQHTQLSGTPKKVVAPLGK